MSVSSVFKMIFMADDRGSISKMRNTLKGVGEQSYVTFNAISRNMSKMEKSTGRLIGKLSMLAGGGGLMYGIFKSLNYSIIQSNSLITTNRILLEEIIGNKGKAREMINVVQEIAGSFGGDVNELMTAGRGLSQIMRQIDKNFQPIHLDKMLRLVNVVSSLDTENRGLSYTSFSFKEALQGVGSGDWRSMRNRLEINLGKTYEKAITQAVRKGNMDEVTRLFEEAFKNIGIDAGQIMGRLMSEGLMQNVNRTASYISRLFQMLGEKSFSQLTKPLAKLNFFLSEQFKKDTGFMKYIEKLSDSFSDKFVKPLTEMMNKVGFAIEPIVGEMGVNMVNALMSVGSVFKNLIMMPLEFVSGLMGVSTSIVDIEDKVSSFNGFLKTTAELGSKISDSFKELRQPLNMLGESINNLVVSLLKLTNIDKTAKVGNGITGLTKNAINLTSGVTNNVAEGVKTADAGIEGIGMGGVMTGLSLISMIAMMRSGRGGRISAKKLKAQEQAEIANAKRFGTPTSNKNVWNEPENKNTYQMGFLQDKINANKRITTYNKGALTPAQKQTLSVSQIRQDELNAKYGGFSSFLNKEKPKLEKEIKDLEKLTQRKGYSKNSETSRKNQELLTSKKDMYEQLKKDERLYGQYSKNIDKYQNVKTPIGTQPLADYEKIPNKIPSTNLGIDLDKKKKTMGDYMTMDNFQTMSLMSMTVMQMGSLMKEGFGKFIISPIKNVGSGFVKLLASMNPLTAGIIILGTVFEGIIAYQKRELDILEAKNMAQINEALADTNKMSELELFSMNTGLNRKGVRNLIGTHQLSNDMIKNLIRNDVMERGGIKENSATYQFMKIQEELQLVKSMGMDEKAYSMNRYSADLTGQDFKSLAINMDLSLRDGTVTKEQMEALRKQINRSLAESRGKDSAKARPTGAEFFQMQLDATKKGTGK